MDIIGLIKRIVCRKCMDRNAELEEDITLCNNNLNETTIKLASVSKDNYNLRNKIRSLEPLSDLPPLWLDTSGKAYRPQIQYSMANRLHSTAMSNPSDMYVASDSMNKLVKSKGWKKMGHNKKLLSIWKHVILNFNYSYDDGEAWRLPPVTHYIGKGDCEDTTCYFITLCMLVGIPSDSVFNACGMYVGIDGSFGHSYPIAKMEDGRWYIFETTITKVPKHPMEFVGNRVYSAKWGLANWAHSGKIIDEDMMDEEAYDNAI